MSDQPIAIIDQLKECLPDELFQALARHDSCALLNNELPNHFPCSSTSNFDKNQRIWELVGLYYEQQHRVFEALAIYTALYYQILEAQKQDDCQYHKGTPLVRMSDCYQSSGYLSISHRLLMLTLIEDAIRWQGSIKLEEVGNYFRLVDRI